MNLLSSTSPPKSLRLPKSDPLLLEWDDSVSVETDEPAAKVAEAEVAEPEVTVPEVASAVEEHEVFLAEKLEETIEEIRFLISPMACPSRPWQVWPSSRPTRTDDCAKLAQLRVEVEAVTVQPAEEAPVAEQQIEELTSDDIPRSVEVAVKEPVEAAAEPEAIEEAPVAVEEGVAVEPEAPAVQEVPVEEIPVAIKVPAAPQIEPEPVPVVAEVEIEAEAAPGVLKEFVSELETSLGDSFLPGTVAKPGAPPAGLIRQSCASSAAHAEPQSLPKSARRCWASSSPISKPLWAKTS